MYCIPFLVKGKVGKGGDARHSYAASKEHYENIEKAHFCLHKMPPKT
jgi:hypothetical protein